jgi:hypothetical protein
MHPGRRATSRISTSTSSLDERTTTPSGRGGAPSVESWGDVLVLRDFENFEALGFDLVQFELADGVRGELAVGHTGNFLTMHGGPYETYVDRTGLLDGVVFPLL